MSQVFEKMSKNKNMTTSTKAT